MNDAENLFISNEKFNKNVFVFDLVKEIWKNTKITDDNTFTYKEACKNIELQRKEFTFLSNEADDDTKSIIDKLIKKIPDETKFLFDIYIKEAEKTIKEKDNLINDKNKEINDLNYNINKLETNIIKLKDNINELKTELDKTNKENESKDNKIHSLECDNKELKKKADEVISEETKSKRGRIMMIVISLGAFLIIAVVYLIIHFKRGY